MLRLLARLSGSAALAAAMAIGVHDGARTIADSELFLTSLGGLGLWALPRQFPALGSVVERGLHPLLWDPVLLNLLRLPAAAVLFGLGFLLLLAGQRQVKPIGPPDQAS